MHDDYISFIVVVVVAVVLIGLRLLLSAEVLRV